MKKEINFFYVVLIFAILSIGVIYLNNSNSSIQKSPELFRPDNYEESCYDWCNKLPPRSTTRTICRKSCSGTGLPWDEFCDSDGYRHLCEYECALSPDCVQACIEECNNKCSRWE